MSLDLREGFVLEIRFLESSRDEESYGFGENTREFCGMKREKFKEGASTIPAIKGGQRKEAHCYGLNVCVH